MLCAETYLRCGLLIPQQVNVCHGFATELSQIIPRDFNRDVKICN